MSEFLKILQTVLPLPVLIAVASIVVFAWILKQIRGYSSNKPLFADRVFYFGVGVSIVGVVFFYAFDLYNLSKPEVEFSTNELGVYICPFKNDPDKIALNTIEAALTYKLDKESLKNVKVFTSNLKEIPHEEHLYDIGLSRNAALVISGQVVHGDKYWVQIANPKDKTTNRVPRPFHLDEPDKIVAILENELLGLQSRSKTESSQLAENQINEANELIAVLQFKLNNAIDRIEKLEKFSNHNGNPSSSDFISADDNNRNSKTLAVLVGIGDYKDDLIDLKYPAADIQAMERALMSNGFESGSIKVLQDSDATKGNIQREMIDFLRKNTTPQDRVLLYYSGHAVTQKTQTGREIGYLCPSDFSFSELVSTGISMNQMKEWFDLIPARQISLIVDACYAGFFGKSNDGIRGIVPIKEVGAQDRIPPKPILMPSGNNRNLIILAAGRANQYAFEGPKWGHGLFTYHILNGLRGKADLDNNGLVQSDELYSYIYPKVVDDSDNRQTPVLFGWGSSSVPMLAIPTR